MSPDDLKKLPKDAKLRPAQVTLALGVSRSTLWRLSAGGKIPVEHENQRTAVYRVKDVRAYLKKAKP